MYLMTFLLPWHAFQGGVEVMDALFPFSILLFIFSRRFPSKGFFVNHIGIVFGMIILRFYESLH